MHTNEYCFDSETIRKATPSDIPTLSRLLAQAFADDPFHQWMYPDAKERQRKHRRSFAFSLRYRLRHGIVLTTRALNSVAGWVPPGEGEPSLLDMMIFGVRGVSFLGKRSLFLMRAMKTVFDKQPHAPHWYLAFLATAPAHQGQGLGKSLLAPVLNHCDQENEPTYLEATSEANAQFYQHHGFTIIDEIQLPDGPCLWAMWRTPQR